MPENRRPDQNTAALTPGSDFVFNFRDDSTSWGRHGNDVLLAFDPAAPTPEAPELGSATAEDFAWDLLLGDFLEEETIGIRRFYARPDVTGKRGQDRFILGDWRTPYYLDDFFVGTQQAAIVADFQPELDTLQLYGSSEDYVIIPFPVTIPDPETGEERRFTGKGLFFKGINPITNIQEFDLIAYFPNVRTFQVERNIFGGLSAPDIDLEADYIKYVGYAPPAGPAEESIQQLGTLGVDSAFGVSVDSHGNVYVIGATTGTLGESNQGSWDFWVAKFDNHGNKQWLKQYGTPYPDLVWDIETFTTEDGEVNFYVAGSTTGVISDALGGNEVNDGYQDLWIARFDSEGNPVLDNDGNPVFVRQNPQPLPGPEIDNSLQIDVDPEGNLYQSGVTVEIVEFNGELSPQDFSWVASYDPDGNPRWFNGDSLDTPDAVAFDESYGVAYANDGTVFATGFTQLGLAGDDAFVGVYDVWISRFDENGEQLFLKQFGSINYDFAWGIDTDSQNNAYIAGWTAGDMLGPDGVPVAANEGFNDIFLAKWSQEGDYEWLLQFGTEGDDGLFLGDIVVDAFDTIYVTGFTNSDLGGPNQGGYDTWVASFDTHGNRNWITQFGSSELDMPTSLDVDNQGGIFVVGYTEGSLGSPNEGATDAWLAKLDAHSGALINFASPVIDPPDDDDTDTDPPGDDDTDTDPPVDDDTDTNPPDDDGVVKPFPDDGGVNEPTGKVKELLDLTGFDGVVTVGITLSREAGYDNLLKFYQTDAQGGVGGLLPGDTGYEDAVRANLLNSDLFVKNRTTINDSINLVGGSYYAPALVIDGKLKNLGTIGDNARIQRDGNVWRFEDWNDNDFNDMVLTVNFIQEIA